MPANKAAPAPIKAKGGAGRGQGRRARDGVQTERRQVGLDEATAEHARELGGGDVSLGLREMSRRLRGQAMQDWRK
jgi:hypothetical protein